MRVADPGGWWKRLGGPNAITLAAWLLTLPGAALTPFVTTDRQNGNEFVPWMLIGIAAHVASGVVLWLAWLTVLRPDSRPSRPWVYVAAVAGAGLLRGLVISFAAYRWGLAPDLNLGFRLTSAIGTVVLWFSLATLIVDGSRRHRTTIALLTRQLDRERRFADESAQFMRDYRQGIVRDTEEVVRKQLVSAITVAADPDLAARRLRAVVDEVVRPLSRELEIRDVRDDAMLEDVAVESERARIPLRSYLAETVSARPFNPLLTVVLVVGSAAFLIIRFVGPMLGVLTLALLGTVIAASSRLAARFAPRTALVVVPTWVLIAAAYSLLQMAVIDALGKWPSDNDAFRDAVSVMAFLLALVAQLAGAVDGAVAWHRARTESDLRDSIAQVEWAAARLRQEAFLEQQQLGRALHGDVQARIVSLALQIQLNPPSDTPAAIAALADHVREVLNRRPETPWWADMVEIEDLWADAIDLSVAVDAVASDMLDRDPVAAHSVVEVVREAVTNAVRHGGADHVRVLVASGPDSVEIEVINDGQGYAAIQYKGMGARIMDAVCMWWSFESDQKTTLRACVASKATETCTDEAIA